MKRVIEVKDIHKEYVVSKKRQKRLGLKQERIVAVNNVSFDVYEGEILCILGTNGAGKTTTLQILSTLLNADSGTILYDGIDAKKNSADIKKKIAFLTSELKLDELFSADYLFDFFSALYNVPKEISEERKNFLFKVLGIESYAGLKVGNLSTGMKQKVAIAISLVHDPEIIIFDEPTNGLDIIASRDVLRFLLEEKRRGKTIIISTHIFEIVSKIADRVIIIDEGNIIYESSIETIQKEGGIDKLFFERYDEVHGA